jgi:para-aminobenzoate synthetase/4-amino-4-deoxychorismate lyase
MNHSSQFVNTPTVILRGPEGGWLSFTRPVEVYACSRADEVRGLLESVEKQVKARCLFAAGFLSYEAAPAFDPSFAVRPDNEFPRAWFGLFEQPETLGSLPAAASPCLSQFSWHSEITAQQYRAGIAKIKKQIAAGDTYQVNYTFRLRSRCAADPLELFLELAGADDPPFGAFIDTGRWAACSASPELFFTLAGSRLESRPMKGTTGRGLYYEHDLSQARALAASKKDRAENIMIADMVRHDMGRIARTGTVRAQPLFSVERFPTVWQMTSTVRGRTKKSIADIMQALFPPASITGAPKTRTMQIISGLETSPRRIYTGAIGFIAPGRQAQFSVAIRTILIDRHSTQAEYGVGGGIVWDSKTDREFQECRIKAGVLHKPRPSFDLLETILWVPERGCWLWEYHLQRLVQSAQYFGFAVDAAQVCGEIEAFTATLAKAPHRLRLLAAKKGGLSITASALMPEMSIFEPVALAARPIDCMNPFLYNKTTCRTVYDEILRDCAGAKDVLLYNDQGEVTETTIANVAVDIDGKLCTPPVVCGLLAGTLRAFLLDRGYLQEKVIKIDQLAECRRFFLLNSVRGMQEVRLILSSSLVSGH